MNLLKLEMNGYKGELRFAKGECYKAGTGRCRLFDPSTGGGVVYVDQDEFREELV